MMRKYQLKAISDGVLYCSVKEWQKQANDVIALIKAGFRLAFLSSETNNNIVASGSQQLVMPQRVVVEATVPVSIQVPENP